MSAGFYICVLISVGIVVSAARRGADALSPARVFAFVWSTAIGLSELKLSKLQHEWSLESWFMLLVGPLSFLCGTFVLFVLNLDSKLLSLQEIRKSWRQRRIQYRLLYNSIVVLFLTFVGGYLVLVLAGKEIPLFSAHPGQARKEFQMFGMGLLTNNIVMIIFLVTLFLLTRERKTRKKWILLTISMVSFIMYAITLQRLNLFIAIILSSVLFYYVKGKIRPATVVFLTLSVLASASISFIRSGGFVFTELLYLSSQMRVPPSLLFVTEPYMYTVMNLEMFVRSVAKLDQFTFGYYTFDVVTSLTGLKHWMKDYFGLVETPFLYSGYNTYTAFWTYYRDFGPLGVAVIGFIGGAAVSNLYYYLRKVPNFITLTAYCFAVYFMLLSLVNSQIGFLWIVYEVLILMGIVYAVSKRGYAKA